jgi:hypothetical protein
VASGKNTKFVVERLTNYNNTAEGPVLPPKQFGPNRVPIVTNLRVVKTELNLGNTNFTLAWDNPQEVNQTASIVDHFNIYVFGAFKGSSQPLGPTTAKVSPAIVSVPCDRATNVTLLVQTVLKSGLSSSIDLSPTCGGATFAPTISISGIGSLGSANQILGMNAAATSLEYKTFATGSTGTDFAIAHGAGTVNFNLPTASAANRGALSTTDWSAFNAKVAATRTISAGTGLTGGGDLSADRTISLSVPVTEVNGGTNQTTYAKGDILGGTGANTLGKLAVGSNTALLTADSTATTGFKWALPATVTVKLGSDRTNNTTSFADATGLSFSVAANTDYLFDFDVIFQTDAVTTGISLSVNGPTSPNDILYDTAIYDGTNIVTANVRAYDTGTATTAIDAANTSTYAKVRGIFRNGANAGTFILRFKSEVGASTVTIKAGSAGKLTTY